VVELVNHLQSLYQLNRYNDTTGLTLS